MRLVLFAFLILIRVRTTTHSVGRSGSSNIARRRHIRGSSAGLR